MYIAGAGYVDSTSFHRNFHPKIVIRGSSPCMIYSREHVACPPTNCRCFSFMRAPVTESGWRLSTPIRATSQPSNELSTLTILNPSQLYRERCWTTANWRRIRCKTTRALRMSKWQSESSLHQTNLATYTAVASRVQFFVTHSGTQESLR